MIMNVTLGENVTFEVLANFGSENLEFQWQNKNTNISEGMSSVLTVMNVTRRDAGNYSCIVSLPFGESITSKEAWLFVCKYNYDSKISFMFIFKHSFTSFY